MTSNEAEALKTRRCLICANTNPCREHSAVEQAEELRRNDAAIASIRHPSPEPLKPEDVSGLVGALEQIAGLDKFGGYNSACDIARKALSAYRTDA